MFAIYVTEVTGGHKKGWLKNIKIHTGEEFADRYNGKQRVEPVFAENRSRIKLWKMQSASVKYANTLASRLETINYIPMRLNPYTHVMRYRIEVIDMDNNRVIHTINNYKFEDTQ